MTTIPKFTIATACLCLLQLSNAIVGVAAFHVHSQKTLLVQADASHRQAAPWVLASTNQEDAQTITTAATPIPTTGDKATGTANDSTNDDFINEFCQSTNNFWKGLVIAPVRDYVAIRPGGTAESDILSRLTAPPEIPGIPRPVWFTILGSVPTALGWYGYYKFSVEEELYQHELQTEGKVSGCGGYGTLFPFVYGILVGFPLSFVGIELGDTIIEAASVWILLGQVNLYRRVNELCGDAVVTSSNSTDIAQPPLHSWWALLPPPLDVVVGLRQVHFLSEYWRTQRDEPYQKDVIAEELFPFISAPRFTLKQFFRTPSMWFWFTKEWRDLEWDILKD